MITAEQIQNFLSEYKAMAKAAEDFAAEYNRIHNGRWVFNGFEENDSGEYEIELEWYSCGDFDYKYFPLSYLADPNWLQAEKEREEAARIERHRKQLEWEAEQKAKQERAEIAQYRKLKEQFKGTEYE